MKITKTDTDYTRLYERSSKTERDVLHCLVYAISPVSLDTLIGLSQAPAVTVLTVMENLKKNHIVSGQKGHGKGVYHLNGNDFSRFLEKHIPGKEKTKILREVVTFYTSLLPEGRQKTLSLAGLYVKLDDAENGYSCVRKAADILNESGEQEEAALYYDYLVSRFSEDLIAKNKNVVDDYLHAALKRSQAARYVIPISQITPFMLDAEKIAQRYEKWDHLAKIKISLGQEFKAANDFVRGDACFIDAWKLVDKVKDPETLKTINFAFQYELCFQGNYLEATKRYEERIGNLEEFGDQEWTMRIGVLLGLCYHRMGRIARGRGMIDEIRAKALSLNVQRIVYFADLCIISCNLDLNKITEAETELARFLPLDEQMIGNAILWELNICMAFVHCAKKEFSAAFEYHKKGVEYADRIGTRVHDHLWIFEYLDALESNGFFDEKFNFDSELRRCLEGENICMKGIAFRYRALRQMAKDPLNEAIAADLEESEKLLLESGAEIELERTRIALGDYWLQRGNKKTAQAYISQAWARLVRIDQNLFPRRLMQFMPRKYRVEVLLGRITEVNKSLGTIGDKYSFLDRVINIAMDFTMATRGAFFFADPENEKPRIAVSRNIDPSLLDGERSDAIEQIVADTAQMGGEMLLKRADKDADFPKSLYDAGVRSLLCMPASLDEKTYGYLYLDNPIHDSSFPDYFFPFLKMLCSQVAVAMSNIFMYEEMRELKNRFEDEAIFYKREMGVTEGMEMIIGQSEGIREVLDHIRQVSATDSSVLILGETGVGKELVAKAIHNLGPRKDGPFIPVNLASLPEDLVASELFGHEKGSFTGAVGQKKGRFELADGGTIFLDEIGDLPLTVQVKLLRVLQEGVFERLGSSKPVKSNFRVIAATNKDLQSEVEKGTFRRDLFYRLSVFPIHVPPLRNRKDDIPLLTNYFVSRFSKKIGKAVRNIPEKEMSKLLDYNWPGNVRELEHIIERSIILFDGTRLHFTVGSHQNEKAVPTPEPDLQKHRDYSATSSPSGANEMETSLISLERAHIEKTLVHTRWRVSGPYGAARILGLKPTTLFTRMKKLGLTKPTANQLLTKSPNDNNND